jgi:prephenate dehydrogenase
MNVGIYGLGRFGAFWAAELAKSLPVKGYNRTRRDFSLPGVEIVSEEELLTCDTIVLCVAISALKGVLSDLAPKLRPGTLVMDTCSVKVYPAQVMLEVLPESVDIIATHPMFGPDSGRDSINGLPLVFSPVRCADTRVQQWISVFNELHLKILQMDCDQHDREAAYSQGVTHFVGRVLDELHLAPTEIATVGYRRLMSIVEQTCNDPIQLFYDLQRYNPYAHDMRIHLNAALDTVLKVLDEHDSAPVEFSE